VKRLFLLFFPVVAQLNATINIQQPPAQKDETLASSSVTTANFAQPVSPGDLIVVSIWYQSNVQRVSRVADDTRANVYTKAVGPTTGRAGGPLAMWRQEIWYAKNIRVGGPLFNVTATFTGTFTAEKIIVAHEYSGAEKDAPLDAIAAATGTTANASSGSAMTHFSQEMIFGSALFAAPMGTNAPGFSLRSALRGTLTEDKNIGTGSFTMNSAAFKNSAQNWIAQMATFRAQEGPLGPGGRYGRFRGRDDPFMQRCRKVFCGACEEGPIIQELVGQQVEPGQLVWVKGCGFGADPPPGGPHDELKILLHLKDWQGNDVPPAVLEIQPGGRTDTDVVALLHEDDTSAGYGVMDQTASLEVIRSATQLGFSPLFPVRFVAKRDHELLRGNDPKVHSLVAGSQKTFYYGTVEAFFAMAGGLDAAGVGGGPVTFGIQYKTDACFCPDSYGTDVNEISPLENGWVLDVFLFDKSVLQDELYVGDPYPPFPYGGTSWRMSIDWWITQNDEAYYDAYVYITGPRGVPW
jgi:hypothetical protein